MSIQTNGIAQVLSAVRSPTFQLTNTDAAAIAQEHKRFVDQNTKRNLDELLKQARSWQAQTRAAANLAKQDPSLKKLADAASTLTFRNAEAVTRPTSRQPKDVTLLGPCIEVRRLRPPDAFLYGSDDGAESVVAAEPSGPVLGFGNPIASSCQTYPDEGVLSVGVAAGHWPINGVPTRFRTAEWGDFDVSTATATLFCQVMHAPELARVLASVDVTVQLGGLGDSAVDPPINLQAGERNHLEWGLASVEARIGLTVYGYGGSPNPIQSSASQVFMGAGATSDQGTTVFQDLRTFDVSASLTLPRGSSTFLIAVDAFVYALSGLADASEVRFAAVDLRRSPRPEGESTNSLLAFHLPFVKISVPELRVTVCVGGGAGAF